jgi:hypothetical protein
MAVIRLDLAHFIEVPTGEDCTGRLWMPHESFRGPRQRSNGVELWWLDGRLIDERDWPWCK